MADPDLHVTGGAGGTYARFEDIELLARRSEELGAELAGIAAECHAMLAHPDVLASAPLNPDGVVRFEGMLLAALDGDGGLGALALDLGGQSAALRLAAASYRAVDEGQAQLIDSIRWANGYLATNPVIALPLAASLPAAYLAGDWLGVDWERLLTDHPGLVDTVVGSSPGLMTGLPGPLVATDVTAGARLLAMLYPDGRASVEDLGLDTSSPLMSRAPAGFGDLLDGLQYRNAQAGGDDQGQIDVRVLGHPDGTRSYIVDIPGTKDWQPTPLREYERLNDLGTNLHAMGGDTTAYQHGVVEALRRVGAGPTDPVMLVGHSQGGIVATQMAADLAGSGAFNVTHVVTAGSPVARIDVPPGVQVLSLENQHDIVPHLDAADNLDRPNVTTVTFASQHGTIGDNHGIVSSYLPAARGLDTSLDPSVLAFRDSAAAFFGADGTSATAHVYEITRD
jgi:pimeloyl-ACP methyl ester carboxylesterase